MIEVRLEVNKIENKWVIDQNRKAGALNMLIRWIDLGKKN